MWQQTGKMSLPVVFLSGVGVFAISPSPIANIQPSSFVGHLGSVLLVLLGLLTSSLPSSSRSGSAG